MNFLTLQSQDMKNFAGLFTRCYKTSIKIYTDSSLFIDQKPV